MQNYRKAELESLARLMSALSSPHRLEILLKLASCCTADSTYEVTEGPCSCVGELARGLGIAPSTVSHHLKELRDSGLIRMERRGQRVGCMIELETLRRLAEFLGHLATSE